MKKIGVISDTHLKEPSDIIERIAFQYFSDVDLIIHAGDLVRLFVLDAFFGMGKEVNAVCGNMDHVEIAKSFPIKKTIRIEDVHIGIIHGWGGPDGMRSRITQEFEGVDAIIYGHTHHPFLAKEGDILFLNPGSPTDNRFTKENSIGIIEVDGKNIQGKIIRL
jgi:putative phosphoesterase